MNKQAALIIFSCLYMLGIIAFFSNYSIPFFILIFLLLCFYIYKYDNFNIKHFTVFSFVFILGIVNSSLNFKYDDNLTSFADKDVNVLAKVISIPSNNVQNRTKFYAKVSYISDGNFEINDVNAKTLITINDTNEKLKTIKIGDNLNLKGRLKVPAPSQNPSQFDYAKYLQFKKTFSLIYVNEDWRISSGATDLKGRILSKLNDKRNSIISVHAKNIKTPMLEILGGIVFGDDAVNPDEETKASFINSGIFHILAASGMNVTLIFGIWFFFAKNLRFNYKFSIIAGIMLIVFYTFMTGFGPPIIRASLMLTLILIGKLIDRSSSTVSLLFLVAFLMLIVNPLMLFDIGFQLSFIVTFALILTSPLLVFNIKNKYIKYILGACCIPVIAQIYAAPLQIYYFNTFTMYSVFANISIIPVLSIVSFLGFTSSILAIIPAISHPVCKIADFILNPLLIYIVKTAQFFANLPNAVKFVPKPQLYQVILYFTVIIFFTLMLKFKIKSKKFIISLCIILLIFLVSFIKIPDKQSEIIYFSVGNADSALIKSPNNKYFMIDTGKTGYLNSPSQAQYIMIKYMKDKGIKHLNSLILSHFDSDHAGGSIDILNEFKVDNLYLIDSYENTDLSANIIKYIKDNNINSVIIKENETIYDKGGFKVSLIKPKGENIKTENQKSLITHISYKNQNFLFMGDGDVNSYEVMPERYKKNISIIKSGHHGAKDTINDEMAKNTDIFVISTGPNIYNHPNVQTINKIEENNKKYIRTDYYNAVKVRTDGNKYKIFNYAPKKRMFVPIII